MNTNYRQIRRLVLWTGGLLLVACFLMTGTVGTAAGQKPNIIFILTDDLGWMDTTPYGTKFYETPAISRLAQRGMLFTQAYSANPLCSPTRASILTGQYPARLRLTTPSCHLKQVVLDPKVPTNAAPTAKVVMPETRTRLPLDYITIAEVLKEAGYKTAHFGKWHLGWPPYNPENQGFDSNLPGGSYPGPPSYFAPYKMAEFKDGPVGEHIDDRMTQHAIEFLKANKNGPFFLNYWMFSVHAPFQSKTNLYEKYRVKVDPNNPQKCPTMGGMVETMDTCVGRLLDTVDQLGIADNTIIIFNSDNGGNMYNEVDGTTPTSNRPLRAGKANIYEGGVRVPLIVVWPGVIKPGSRSQELVMSIDYHPTILDILGLKPKPGQIIDGISILLALKQNGPLPRDTVFNFFPHNSALPEKHMPAVSTRQGDWKLIRFFFDGPQFAHRYELYNLKDDLEETKNLAETMPDKVKSLDALITKFLKDTDALVPIPNPAYDPTRVPIAGWHASPDAKLSLKNGALVVESTGFDPNVHCGDVPAIAGAFTAKLRMRSSSAGEGHFYWQTGKKTFNRNDRLDLKPQHDNAWHEYSLDFKTDGKLSGIRIDPSSAKGIMELDWVKLYDSQKALLKSWEFDH